jgi:hypothetical protein
VPIFSADKSFSEPDSPFVDDKIAAHFEIATEPVKEPIVTFVPAETHEAKAFEPSPYAYADAPPSTPQLTIIDDVPVLKPAPITSIKPSALPHGVVVDPSQAAASYASYGVPESTVPAPISSPPVSAYGTAAPALDTAKVASPEQAQSAEIDRVDELLRKFRERYGRSDS